MEQSKGGIVLENIILFLKNNEFIIKLLMAAAELAAGFLLAPFIRSLILRLKVKGVDTGVLTFTSSAASILIKFLAIVVALAQIGVDVSMIVGAFSAIGLGVSLAMKESMANVAGGLQILINKPFKVGDYIAMGDVEGTCMQIEIMYSILETVNKQQVIIPNASLCSNTLINYSEYPLRRIVISVPVGVDCDYRTLRAKLFDLMDSDSRVEKDPLPKTVIAGFSDSGYGMKINMICYCDRLDYWDLLYMLNEQVHEILYALDIKAPVQMISFQQSSADARADADLKAAVRRKPSEQETAEIDEESED